MKWIALDQLKLGQQIYGVADLFAEKIFEAPGVVAYKCDDYCCGVQWTWGDFEIFHNNTVFKVKEDLRSLA